MTDRKYQVCNHCVMDTSDSNIVFDENGVCERCNEYEKVILPRWNYGKGHEEELKKIVDEIKKSGQGKKYDCILGLSGGFDSTYMLHYAVKELGLRPFVYHVDAGWDLPVAVENIHKVCDKLGIELHIETMDWEEMRQMQIAFFRTGMPDMDVPQDGAFIAMVDKFAKEIGVKYILSGGNTSTEVVVNPKSWKGNGGSASDGRFIRDVVKKYCDIPIKKYPYTNVWKRKFWYPYVLGIKTLRLLDYTTYIRKDAEALLVKEYGYVPYGQKHFEDLLTKFLEGYWLPTRFGYDIRRAQLSSLVLTGQMTRDEALKILKNPPLTEEESKELFSAVAKKLEISEEELRRYHDMPISTEKFKNNNWQYVLGEKVMLALGKDKLIRK